MKKILFLWTAIVIGLYFVGASSVYADMTWNTPYGTIGLPLTASEALIGYDAVLKQAVAGFSVPLYTDPKKILSLQIGAVAPWQTNGATIEPYVAGGLDVLRFVPAMDNYQSAHVNIFGRWASEEGKAGLGIAFSYSFAAPTPVTPAPVPLSN